MALARGGTGIGALVVIGGSTASGKSALAASLAKATGGTVVNADSQQLYRDLPTLTARPTPAEEAEAPHRLYGVLGPDEQASVGRWLDLVASILREAADDPRPLIVTGGTGLYLEALLHGIVPVPDIPPGLRARLRAEAAGVPAPSCTSACAARTRPPPPACARATRSGSCARSRSWRRPAGRWPSGRPQHGGACRCLVLSLAWPSCPPLPSPTRGSSVACG